MKTIKLQSARLTLYPRSEAQMMALWDREDDAEMKKAYGEMLAEMRRIPDRQEWASDWAVCLRDGAEIGGVGFKGVPDGQGIVELGYGIDEAYRRCGYATEAVAALLRWALEQPDVLCVQAQTEPDNEISQRVLARNGFLPCGQGEEGPLFEVRKEEKAR